MGTTRLRHLARSDYHIAVRATTFQNTPEEVHQTWVRSGRDPFADVVLTAVLLAHLRRACGATGDRQRQGLPQRTHFRGTARQLGIHQGVRPLVARSTKERWSGSTAPCSENGLTSAPPRGTNSAHSCSKLAAPVQLPSIPHRAGRAPTCGFDSTTYLGTTPRTSAQRGFIVSDG